MNTKWIAAWGCAESRPHRNLARWCKDTTVRMNMLMTVNADAIRIHFTNRYGNHPVTLSKVTVAPVSQGNEIDPSRLVQIKFDGKEQGEIPAYSRIVSDEVDFEVKAGDKISVNMYFGEFTEIATAHHNNSEFIEKWVVSGDKTSCAALPVNENALAENYPFIHTIDARCSEDCYSIIAFGDSITAQTWPDRLARRLLREGITTAAVVRRGIGGNRVLRAYPCDTLTNYGDAGVDRFESEVTAAGVKKVFILHGINDIIHPDGSYFRPMSDQPTAEELTEGYKKYIEVARKHGLEIYQSAILPFKNWRTYNEEKEQVRLETNRRIYACKEINGVLPFEAAVRDENDAQSMKSEFDSGDHLHPSGAGAEAMANSIPLEFIK